MERWKDTDSFEKYLDWGDLVIEEGLKVKGIIQDDS